MRYLLVLLLLFFCVPVQAQVNSFVVQDCGVLPSPYSAGTTRYQVIDVNGNTCAVLSANMPPVTISTISTSALVPDLVVKSAGGWLHSFQVSVDTTLSGNPWWIMLYDATSAPSDGSVTPLKCYAMTSGTVGYSAGFGTPIAFTTGAVIGVGTTGCFTKTASPHAFISGDVQ